MRRKILSAFVALFPVGCATTAAPLPTSTAASGILVVYSATYPSTLEESEYPSHTDYTVATANDAVVERVSNRTGSFDKRPASVNLSPGEYHVRAQFSRGGFVTVPVVIETGKITTLTLDGSPIPASETPTPMPIHGPNGAVIGWQVTTTE
jgi:hypothetical protein